MAKRPTNYISYRQLTSNPKLNGQPTDYKDHTDPKYIGPGKWHDIHQLAWRAQDKVGKDMFKTFMTNTCENFPCSTCKTHCIEYMQNHPMKNYEDVLVEVGTEHLSLGLFVWAWKFHNSVNAKLGKPQMSWNTCYNMYSGKPGLICSKACLYAEIANEPQLPQQPIQAPIVKSNYYVNRSAHQFKQLRQEVPLFLPVAQPINNEIINFQQVPGFRR